MLILKWGHKCPLSSFKKLKQLPKTVGNCSFQQTLLNAGLIMPSGHFSATYDHTFRALWINCGSLMCFFLATIGICVTEEQIQLDNQNSHSMRILARRVPLLLVFFCWQQEKKQYEQLSNQTHWVQQQLIHIGKKVTHLNIASCLIQ